LTLTSPRCPKLMNSVKILWWLVSSRHVAVETHWISTVVQTTQFFPCFQGWSLLSFVFLFFHFPFFIFFSFYWCVVRSENTISLSLGHSSIIQVDLIVSMEKLKSTLVSLSNERSLCLVTVKFRNIIQPVKAKSTLASDLCEVFMILKFPINLTSLLITKEWWSQRTAPWYIPIEDYLPANW
jgi:hypothetical protein